MKINKQRNISKKVVISILAGILLIAALLSAPYLLKLKQEDDRHKESLISVDANKDSTLESEKNNNSIEGSTSTKTDDKTIVPSESDDDINKSIIEKPTITRASQSSGHIRISAIFSKPANGTCVVIFEKKGYESLTRTASIVVGASYYNCDGFLIPASDFPSKGDWEVKVIHKQNEQSISSDSQTIGIE